MSLSCTEVIDALKLEPLPLEGGYFRSTYTSEKSVASGRGHNQPVGTAIYFLITKDNYSAIHRLKEDEIFHFYLGSPVVINELSPEEGLTKTVLGPNLAEGQVVQHRVNKNTWQGTRLIDGGEWALLGTTMAPGFAWEDFELGNRKELLSDYPEHQELILELTREQD